MCFVLKHQLLVTIHLCSHHWSDSHTVKPVLSSHPALSSGLLEYPVCFPSVMVFSPLLSDQIYEVVMVTFEWVPTACLFFLSLLTSKSD